MALQDLTGKGNIDLMKKERHLKLLEQTKVDDWDRERDAGRPAKLPGKKISKRGKIYWETRQNRTDSPLKKT